MANIKDYWVSDDVVVYVNKSERHVTMHVKHGTTYKDWVIMDCVPKKIISFHQYGIRVLTQSV